MTKIKLDGIDLESDKELMELEASKRIVTLGFFWSTIGFDRTPTINSCRKIYDERTKSRDCDFARTLLLLEKEPKGSKLWKLLIKNSKIHLKEETHRAKQKKEKK